MFLKKIHIHNYKLFKDVEINLEKSDVSDVFSVASVNGGGKSTLLQFIFIMLHCPLYKEFDKYIENLLNETIFFEEKIINLVDFSISHQNKDYNLNFLIDTNNREIKDEDYGFEVIPLSRKFSLFIDTTMNDNLLEELSQNIFLISPNSQVFHFLNKDDKEKIAKPSIRRIRSLKRKITRENQELLYSEIVTLLKNDLKNFETYDLFSTKVLFDVFEKAFESDINEKIETEIYGNNYDSLKEDLGNFLEDKTIIISPDRTEVFFKLKNKDFKFSYTDLSHGELKKLGLFIWLKYFVPKDSIVLMDEIDIALHPSWQYELVDDLEEWSAENTQFFLATHSPQILSSTYYKNLILLDKKDNYSTVHQLDKPLDNNDVNSVIDLIMGTNHLPKKLDRWHMEYRSLVKEGKEESKEAKEIKKKILEWESINSSFFRRIDFFKKMKK